MGSSFSLTAAREALPVLPFAARRLVARGMIAGIMLAIAAQRQHAQVWTPAAAPRDTLVMRPEARIDWFGGRAGALHAGAGVSVRAGNYLRVGVNAGAGRAFTGSRNAAHADVTARFMLDPFRQERVGVSLGGGVGVRHEDDRVRAFALLFIDAEAGQTRRWMPFARAGLGGGPRLTVGIRRIATRSR